MQATTLKKIVKDDDKATLRTLLNKIREQIKNNHKENHHD